MTTSTSLRSRLDAVMQTATLTEQHLDLLRWLVWLSLLSRQELARVTKRHDKTLWTCLKHLCTLELLDYIIVNEPGWPRHHHRYHLTDLGLHAVAHLNSPPLSAAQLAARYPVTHADLRARVARLDTHLILSEFVTRLLAEHPPSYSLISYQQPFKESFRDATTRARSILFDAAFLLQTPRHTQHAFYLWVDQAEHMMSQKEVKAVMKRFLELRQTQHLSRDVMPHLLLFSRQERFAFWAEQVNRATLKQGIALLNVHLPEAARVHMDLSWAIADVADLTHGAYAPLWTPFHTLILQNGQVEPATKVSVLSLLERSASPVLTERFSQSFSFQRSLHAAAPETSTRRKAPLPSHVGIPPHREAQAFIAHAVPRMSIPHHRVPLFELRTQLSQSLHADPAERDAISALITLALSEQQKELLAHLGRHPFLSRSDLLVLARIEQQDEKMLLRQIAPLERLQLATVYPWPYAPTWREGECYYLLESGLRYLATRHALSPAYYLEPAFVDRRDWHRISPLADDQYWIPRGAKGLQNQMYHTNGLYRSVRHMHMASHATNAYSIVYWKNAREALGWFHDGWSQEIAYIRPDAALLYTTPAFPVSRSLLIEYDRGTTSRERLEEKFSGYTTYQYETRSTLPPIVVITPDGSSEGRIWQAVSVVKAYDVPLVLVREEQVLREGLIPLLPQLDALNAHVAFSYPH